MPVLAGPAMESVYAVTAVDGASVTTLPTVPVTDHFPTVVVVLDGSVMVCATVLVEASSPKVFAPVIVNVDVPVVPPIVSLL